MKTTIVNFYLTVIFAVVIFLGVTTMTNGQPVIETNSTVPLIKMANVPITTAIEYFTRQSDINFVIDPKLSGPFLNSTGSVIQEPTVTFTWTNMSARNALARLLKEHNLVMVKDSTTTVERITYTNQIVNSVDASLLGSDTNAAIPLIQMNVVPLDLALNTFAYEDHIKVVFYDELLGIRSNPGKPPVLQPLVSIRWQNITPKQAIVALCENYNLAIVKDSVAGTIRIKPKD
jgi:hypothetical protein